MDFSYIISNLLFPGIILHELAHAFACLVLGVKIKKIKWIGKNGGFVEHLDSKSWKIIIISLIPFFFNLFLSYIFYIVYNNTDNIIWKIVLVWLAISAIFHSLPSKEDAKNVFSAIKKEYLRFKIINILINIILLPITIIILIITILFRIVDRSIYIRILLVFAWVYFFLL